MRNDKYGIATVSIHAGEVDYASSTPIHQGATVNGLYYRSGNPTCAAFEEKVCTLEGGTRSVSTACGMAAISQTLLALLSAGSRLVTHRTVYTWTTELFQRDLPRLGVEVVFIDMREPDQLAGRRCKRRPTWCTSSRWRTLPAKSSTPWRQSKPAGQPAPRWWWTRPGSRPACSGHWNLVPIS